jgi:hypothetical protein
MFKCPTLPTYACLSALTILCLCSSNPVEAQNPRGALTGIVQDTSGARVPAASILIRETGTTSGREITADAEGAFRLDDLQPGGYELVVTSPGFAEARASVTVAVSSTRAVTVTLQPAAVTEAVRVRGAASSITTQPLDPTTAVHQGVVTLTDLETIPLAHRSFANIAYLVPGTAPVEPSDPTKARITAVSFGGSSGLNVEASVDGGDNSDDYIGGFLQNYSPDAIQEFAVRTAQQDADTGRTTGGSVVITTRRGTNAWHSDLAFYERAAALNARAPIDNPPPEPKQSFSRQNYVATVGGPLAPDKLWLFSSLEYVHENASIAYSPASLEQFNALASLASQNLIPGVTSIAVPTEVPVPFYDYLWTTRLDWSQSPRSQWVLRLAGDKYRTENDLVQQGTLPSTGATSDSRYLNALLSNQFMFGQAWLASFTFDASLFHHTAVRNQYLGFALAFPFSATSRTTSGFETFGDNQFVTPITAFPVLRDQNKYQFRYDLTHQAGRHTLRAGVNIIYEPTLSGALSGTAESLTVFPMDPTDYLANPQQFAVDLTCTPTATIPVTDGTTCTNTPAGDGTFSQSVKRLGLYVQDTWRAAGRLTLNYGLRYDTTFGLFTASGRTQLENPAFLTLQALQIPLVTGAPHDYRKAIAPRFGVAYGLDADGRTVIRGGIGLYYNDLAQNGWVTALQAVNAPPGPCATPGDLRCLPGSLDGGAGALIDPAYKTPFALHVTAGVERAFTAGWTISADWTHQDGRNAYRAYEYKAGYSLTSPLFPPDQATQQANVPDISVYRTDNRSRYDALSLRVQRNARQFNLTASYTLARANTWGCVLGELFDYVNGVCNPMNAFGSGDYGPSGRTSATDLCLLEHCTRRVPSM